ncbi:hypothetical protein M3P21_16305 [Ruegeria sp. 2012CJ41-6]|uniref:Uncharacterized protein n=1 Tax=Ruegeria spongiae TaxID=2942209 RepID=A0ABT0Q5H5_9RHOB|nr:hypothetical protein [Ruegeria spongiae]MCL6285093.1 hypothetical protein [Ruegeria spongiae]
MQGQGRALTVTGDGAEAGPGGNLVVLDEARSFAAPEGLFQIPRIESGEEVFEVDIPEGLQLSLIDLATPGASLAAGAEVVDRPARGATSRLRLLVRWSHPVPTGSLQFRLRVHASPDGTPPPVVTPLTEPGSHNRMRALIEQDAAVDLAIDGPVAETFRTQILERGGQFIGAETQSHLARPFDGGLSAGSIVLISLAVIAAVCVVVGFATFGAVLIIAMQKGYNIENAGYNVAVGEGASRQEHEMVFNIRKPE